MALEIRQVVTQPCHGPGGEVIADVGQQFPLGAEMPDNARWTTAVVEVPDAAPEKAAKGKDAS